MKQSKAVERFNRAINALNNADTDHEKAIILFNLLEDYRAFRTMRHARLVNDIIDKEYKKEGPGERHFLNNVETSFRQIYQRLFGRA